MIESVKVDGYTFSVDYGDPDCGDKILPYHEDLDNWTFPESIDPDAQYAGAYDETINKAMEHFRKIWPDVRQELEEPFCSYDRWSDFDVRHYIETGERSWL